MKIKYNTTKKIRKALKLKLFKLSSLNHSQIFVLTNQNHQHFAVLEKHQTFHYFLFSRIGFSICALFSMAIVN